MQGEGVAVSFVPLTGTARFRAATPPRDGVVEFSDDRRTVALPIRAALPVLTKAQRRDDLHPSVGLLSAGVLLGMRLVAAGKFEPSDDEASWRIAPLGPDDADRVSRLAASRAGPAGDPAETERVVRALLDAVADAMPRTPPAPASRRTTRAVGAPSTASASSSSAASDPAGFAVRLQERIARHRGVAAAAPDAPTLVRLSLRVEADEEELVAGSVRVVLQVHDELDPLHVRDAADLWLEEPAVHGFGDRARVHTTIALRAAAEAWPPLERVLDERVPDRLTLETDDLVSLLETGVGALRAAGVDVLWPRSLGRDLAAGVVLEEKPKRPQQQEAALLKPLLGTETLFAFRWQLTWQGEPLSAEEMDALARSASPVVKLRGAWAVVDPSVARKAKKRLIRTVGAGPALAAALTGEVPGLDDDASAATEPLIVGASLLRLREEVLAASSRTPLEPPPGLYAQLRDYQRHGLTWLADLTRLGLGGCLADDMGLGKTVTVIALHLHRVAAGATGPTLVVCPASLLGNWEAEIARFAPGVDVRRFHGSGRDLTGVGDGFVLTTYGTMRLDAERLAGVDWDLVVADEAQHVKNARASTAKALRTIGSRARVALTGTPVENDLTELWSILDWAVPGLLGSRQAFRRVWAAPIETGDEPTKARQFADLVSPFLLRRRKSDPGIAPELPAKTETDHPLSLTREQTVLYETFVRDMMERIERADPHARRGLVLSLLTGLKQICNHPAHFLKQSGAVRLAGRSEKLDLLDELLATVLAEGGAMLVFTQYVAMARLLEAHLDAQGVAHQFLHGGTPVRQREAMVARFQAGPDAGGPPVFLLSLKAGGTGLNLTRADHVVHLDRWWNPAVEEQATDRAYRIGQTQPVQVHRMICRGTVEEKVAELLARKRGLADAVLGRGETALTELDDDELRDLVSLDPRRGT